MARVERHGNGWRAVYTGANGARVREALPARTKAEAKELAAKLERRVWLQRRGLEVTAEELTGTLGELCAWWLEKRCPAASRDGGATSGLQKHVIRAEVGKLPLARLRSSHLDDLLHQLADAGAAPATLNNLRALLHVAFAKAKKAGRWVGDNPMDAIERRKVPKRVYVTLTPDELARMLDQVPEDWRPIFACGPALGLRKGELFALRKTDVDMARGTLAISRSHDRDTTKGGDAALLPIPAPLRPWIEHQLRHAPGALLFPAANGAQRSREADPQKVLRHALARAGIVRGYEHRCRWCSHKEQANDAEPRFCPTCLKLTDGRGRALVPPRGRRLWPVALHVRMRFHDLRHTFATALLRAGVDVHRVQRLMRHSDVRVTTGTYSHLMVEDLRAVLDEHTHLAPPAGAEPAEIAARLAVGEAPQEPHAGELRAQQLRDDAATEWNAGGKLERETGFEPATLSLGS
jgi:integrase